MNKNVQIVFAVIYVYSRVRNEPKKQIRNEDEWDRDRAKKEEKWKEEISFSFLLPV